MNIAQINVLLAQTHGKRNWHPHHEPLAELVAVILSQNTSDINSQRAFESLLSVFPSWEDAANADVHDIQHAIRSGGLSKVKASRIKEILKMIQKERGNLNLNFLNDIPLDEAKSWLLGLPGVGVKSVACVLLFAFGKPVFPVDTHVLRVSKRLRLIPPDTSANRAHELLGELVLLEDVYQVHMNMVEHGRKVCMSQRPNCPACILKQGCPSVT